LHKPETNVLNFNLGIDFVKILNMELISCITPTFNRSKLLEMAILSCLNQSYPEWEMIIVDDGSTDDTESVVQKYMIKDKRIKYFHNPKKGAASARNYGILQSKGKYIAFLDDDDINLPYRFESQLNAAKNSGSGFIVSGYWVADRNTGRILSEHKLELKGEGAGFTSRWFIKKELLETVGGFCESFPSMMEIELSYRIATHERFVLHDRVVSVLNLTANSVSRNKNNSLKGKVMLMEQLGENMLPAEAAWWYFIIGIDYYCLSDIKNAKKYIRKASELRNSFPYKLGNVYASHISSEKRLQKKINIKILQTIANHNFPLLVKHPVVK